MDSTNSGGAQGNADDHLGYSVYAQTLWERIQAALNRDLNRPDKSLGEDPLVVGIFGEWGSGKSFLLRQVMDKAKSEANRRITEHKSNDTAPLTVPVFFQPWKYEHEKHLLVPLLLHIQSDLQSALQRAMPEYSRNRQWLEKSVNTLAKHIGQVVDVFGLLMDAALKAFQIAQPQAMMLMPVAKTLASWLPWNKAKAAPPTMAQFRFDDTGGRSYYEMHAILKAITRPSLDSVKKYLPQTRVDQSFSVNFVVFIDDLDRCLPEKSVEVLELIKTVFNLESFAFVLALDDEVVERGIGHRYKDYALQNKKPEMPITGFEYLEKIVHLPLRLPPLTTVQATKFLERYEQKLLQERSSRGDQTQAAWIEQRTWFSQRTSTSWTEVQTRADGTSFEVEKRSFLFLGNLVVASFASCAPRKLVRVVELWHQVLDVLEQHCLAGKPSSVKVGGDIDPRLLMAVVLLQLFQPELFRSMQRSKRGFDVLLDGFKVSSEQPTPLTDGVSEVDLLHWAVYQVGEKPPLNISEALGRVAYLDIGKRSAAQRQRLPIAVSLLDHRSTQRHSFDPLKLFAALHRSREGFDAVGLPGDAFPYFSVLSSVRSKGWFDGAEIPIFLTATGVSHVLREGDEGSLVEPVDASVEGGRTLQPDIAKGGDVAGVENFFGGSETYRRISEPMKVFQMLISPEDAEQRHVADVAGLSAEAPLLHPESSQVLRGMVEREFLNLRDDDEISLAERRERVLSGLSYLAPHIPPEECPAWWALVEDAPHQPAPFENREQLHTQARWMDVRSAMGVDADRVKGRFDPKCLYLPRKRHDQHTEAEEPIEGFVWVVNERAEFKSFDGRSVTLSPYCMARYLTTVDQYSAFLNGDGYKQRKWWDSQGWAWVTGEWDSHEAIPESLKGRLAQRPLGNRLAPDGWAEQRRWGSRPVFGVNWFEARAYARWLNEHASFREKLNDAGLEHARVELPVEVQWERAARASGFGTPPDEREFVWTDEKVLHELWANIARRLGRCSPVGLYPANPLGLCDVNGNLWEWQDNLRSDSGRHFAGERIPELKSSADAPEDLSDWLGMQEDVGESAQLAVRGGSWFNFGYKTSSRGATSPETYSNVVGFRLVLSLAEQSPEV